MIATPEHNGGYTALPKNALDWMSRPDGFPSGKVAAPISASLGLPGGAKSQLSLQIVLSNLGVHVIPESFALGATHQLFDAEGGLKDPMARGRFAASAQHSRRWSPEVKRCDLPNVRFWHLSGLSTLPMNVVPMPLRSRLPVGLVQRILRGIPYRTLSTNIECARSELRRHRLQPRRSHYRFLRIGETLRPSGFHRRAVEFVVL